MAITKRLILCDDRAKSIKGVDTEQYINITDVEVHINSVVHKVIISEYIEHENSIYCNIGPTEIGRDIVTVGIMISRRFDGGIYISWDELHDIVSGITFTISYHEIEYLEED